MIRIPAPLLERIKHAALAAWPAECCGLLLGKGPPGHLRIEEIVEAANLMAATPDRFELDPAVRIRVEKECRGGPLRLVGHYHSHPDGSPLPSAHDLERALEPNLVWLIVAAGQGQVPTITAHRPTPDRRRFRPVRLQESTCNPPASSP